MVKVSKKARPASAPSHLQAGLGAVLVPYIWDRRGCRPSSGCSSLRYWAGLLPGRRWKKAVVTLAEGYKIQLIEGV